MVRTSVESGMSYEFEFDRSTGIKFWAAQIQAGTWQDYGRAQYNAGQLEPTRDTLEPDLSKSTVQAYVQVRDAKNHPEAKTRGRHHTIESSGGTSMKPDHHPQSPQKARLQCSLLGSHSLSQA